MDNFNEYKNQVKTNARLWLGTLAIIFGTLLLLDRLDIAGIPHWVFSWKVILIIIGIFAGIRSSFRDLKWLILVTIGGVFLLRDLEVIDFNAGKLIWPLILIIVGMSFIFSKKKRKGTYHPGEEFAETIDSDESVIDVVAIFGGNKKNIFSKNFKGGDIIAVFGGNEINLSQADIKGKVKLDVVQVFGGTKLIIPSNWHVKTEMVSIFGGLDDKRMIKPVEDHERLLIIEGVSIFGGIDIRSY